MAALGEKPVKDTQRIPLGNSELAAFNMREAAKYFGVDPGVIAPRKRAASIAS